MTLVIRDKTGEVTGIPEDLKNDIITDGIMCNITKLLARGYTVEMSGD